MIEKNMTHQEADWRLHLAMLVDSFSAKVPFNQVIGLHFEHVDETLCSLSFSSRSELIGNYVQNILHGGVIATVLDVAGGTMAAVSLIQRHHHLGQEEVALRMAKLGTIDIRIDYLRPGRGEKFTATASLLRGGNKVAVARMELHNESGDLIAVGTGTYLVG
jgi:uncharacterized protein (TIGR00369 family)